MSSPFVPPPSSRRDRRQRPESTPEPAASRAGRNLPMAIAVGVGLGVMVLASLLIDRRGFVVVATVASVVGAAELLHAMGSARIHPPVVPTLVAAAGIPSATFLWGAPAVLPAIVAGMILVVVWGAATESGVELVRGVAAGALIVLYVPAMVAFVVLLVDPADGVARVVTFIVVVVASDTGGYTAGVLKGRHPMAPTVSPKKSWEGFAGSVVASVIAGIACVVLALDGPWWVGLLLGLLVVVAATVGDLCESMIKRDLGVKDMSNLIPGHGGLMDRLDSLILAVPVTWAVLTYVGVS